MYKAKFLSPMVPSYNIQATVLFFVDLLGFEIIMDSPDYAIVSKDDNTVHILHAGKDIGQMEFYLEVDDIEMLWKTIQNKLDTIIFKGPFDRDYGMREVHIGIPETNTLLFIGQYIG